MVQKWAEIIGQACQSVDFLKDQGVIRSVLNILQAINQCLPFIVFKDLLEERSFVLEGKENKTKRNADNLIPSRNYTNFSFRVLCEFVSIIVKLQTNTSVASSLGTYFLSQMSLIFLDMLNVYRFALVHWFLSGLIKFLIALTWNRFMF